MKTAHPAGAFDVLARTREAMQREADPAAEGRPASLMLAGGLLAIVAAVFCSLLARQVWLTNEVGRDTGTFGVGLLFVLFAGGVYVFALGYEMNDTGRALRLTLIIAVAGVAALALMVGVFAAMAWVRSGMGALSTEKPARTVFGLVSGLEDGEDDAGPKRHPLDFLISCKRCKRDFTPVPPDAICPWCDTPYLSA